MKKDNLLTSLLGPATLLLVAVAAMVMTSCSQDTDEPGGGVLPEGKITLAPTMAPVAAWSTADGDAPGTRADAPIATSLTGGEIAIEISTLGADGNSAGTKIGCNYYSVSADGKLTRLPYDPGNLDETEADLAVDAAGEYWMYTGGTATLTTDGIEYSVGRVYNDGAKVIIAADGKLAIALSIDTGGLRLNVKNADNSAYTGTDVTAKPLTISAYGYGASFEVKTLTAAAPAVIWGDISPSSSVNAGDPLLELATGGKTYRVLAPRQISFLAARLYTFNVRVGATGITVSSDDLGIKDFELQPVTDAEAETKVKPVSKWDGTTPAANPAATFSGGDGTSEATAYSIGSAADFAQLAANVNAGTNYDGVYFRLDAILYLQDHPWTPIGSFTSAANHKPFKGTFDGDHSKITGLNVNSDLMYAGLFGDAGTATIKNLHVSGTVVGTSTSTDSAEDKQASAGGICGYSGKEISGCSFSGSVTAAGYAGGIAGTGYEAQITACKNSGTITGGTYTGGIVGYSNMQTEVWDSYNEGRIKGANPCGIASQQYGAGDYVYTSYNIGNVQGTWSISPSNNTGCYTKVRLTGYDATEFAAGAWPDGNDTYNPWKVNTVPAGEAPNGNWKSLGSWNGGNPVYPKLWWE